MRLPPCAPPRLTPPVSNAEAMYRKPVGAAILCRAGNNDDGLDGKCMVARKGGGRNARHNVGGLAGDCDDRLPRWLSWGMDQTSHVSSQGESCTGNSLKCGFLSKVL